LGTGRVQYLAMKPIQYPATRRTAQTDTYFGTEVADPYRWLEDDHAPETLAWVEAQNAVTFKYLESLPYREAIAERLRTRINYVRYGVPYPQNNALIFSKNDGLQNQSVLYIQAGKNGKEEVLFDPNALSEDSTIVLGMWAVSKDEKYLAYAVSDGGSDWKRIYIMDIATRALLSDELLWVKVSGIAWQGDGFYYSRYPATEAGDELSSRNENHQVCYHTVGTAQSEDKIVYEDTAHLTRFHTVSTTEDERFAILTISDRGTGKEGNALFVREMGKDTWLPLIAEITDSHYHVAANLEGDAFLIETNDNAPNGKVVLVSLGGADETIILPEQEYPLATVAMLGGKLVTSYMKDATHHLSVYSINGQKEYDIPLPGPGSVAGLSGREDSSQFYFAYTTFNYPTTIFSHDLSSQETNVYKSPTIPLFDADAYTVKQVFYESKDGTRVPMFLVHQKEIAINGQNPTLLYGYGGFNISLTPSFSPNLITFLEQGGVYAMANLRGGSEYGEKWHQAGMRLNKQNVFDDFIAAAEWLIENNYTQPAKLAIQGGSNGGLLVGATLNQRPDLFAAAIPQVGVMDMLRFHHFTIGWNWIPDYGSSEASEADFHNLYRYSPVHNLKNTTYPATLVTTADHDDRVVPAHSFKYAATMQHVQQGDAPVLIRIGTKSGHGASNLQKSLEEIADIYTFLFTHLGIAAKF
jgi:prolyl oligopeptidase